MSKNERGDDGAQDSNQKDSWGSTRNKGPHGGNTDNRSGNDKGNSHGNERR